MLKREAEQSVGDIRERMFMAVAAAIKAVDIPEKTSLGVQTLILAGTIDALQMVIAELLVEGELVNNPEIKSVIVNDLHRSLERYIQMAKSSDTLATDAAIH